VLNSEVMCWPVQRLDISPTSDGAAALVLASEDVAKKLTDNPVWIDGVGWSVDSTFWTNRDLYFPTYVQSAARMAYKMAGIKNPPKEIDVAEVYDAFSYMELMWMEGLGFCGRGEGGLMVDSGVMDMNGRLPVNPSGGVLSAHAVQAAGLARIAEAVMQLRGEAGGRQVEGAKVALAHGIEGACGQGHCVFVLGNQNT